MASSIYVYKSMSEYENYYDGKEKNLIYQIPIIDMYIDPKKEKLFVITNQSETVKTNIEYFRTIVHVRQESWVPKLLESEYETKLVEHGKFVYNGKTGWIEFFPRFLRKPRMRQHVDRCLGGAERRKYKIDYDKRFYDYAQDRINLILKEPKA